MAPFACKHSPVLLARVFVSALSLFIATSGHHVQAQLAYIAQLANDHVNDQVLVLDTKSNSIVATVPGGVQPFAVAITPDASRAYVANRGSNDVTVIDVATNTVVATVALETNVPQGVAITPDGGFAYVTGGNVISVIDTKTNTVATTIPIGISGTFGSSGTPNGIAANPKGGFVYAVVAGVGVEVVDTSTNTSVNNVQGFPALFALRVSPDGAFIWVLGDSSDGTQTAVFVIDSTTLQIVAEVPLGSSAEYLAFTPDGAKVYVTHVCSSGCDDVTVVDASSKSVIAGLAFGGGPNLDVAITPAATTAYVLQAGSFGNRAVLIDTNTNTVSGSVAFPSPSSGSAPFAIAIQPNTATSLPAVTLSQSSVGFGMQQIGGVYATSSVQLTNTGTGPLTISSIQKTGSNASDFSESSTCPIAPDTVAPGGQCVFTVGFAPTQSGVLSASISITDNASGSPHSISLSGTAVDFSVAASPASASIKGGKANAYTVLVTPLGGNTLAANLSVSGCPANATCTVLPSQVTLDGSNTMSSTLTVKGNGKTPKGTFTLIISGKVFTVSHSTNVSLTVQ